MLDALMSVMEEALPVNVALTILAEKLPLASLETIVLAPFAEFAVV